MQVARVLGLVRKFHSFQRLFNRLGQIQLFHRTSTEETAKSCTLGFSLTADILKERNGKKPGVQRAHIQQWMKTE